MANHARRVPWLTILCSFSLAACMHSSTGPGDTSEADSNSFSDEENGDRETVLIEPKEGADTVYDIRPAVLDTAFIRLEDRGAGGAIVEVLLKGYFPDGCSELNELDQEPMREGQRVSLTMRRPADAICTQAIRPYRFFFTLDRRFTAGRYTLLINGRPFDFEVGAG